MIENSDGNTPLDLNETAGLKFTHVTTRGELDELEQANVVQGLRWLGRKKGGDILTASFLRTLHAQLFGDVWRWAGAYRLREKNIGVDPVQISTQVRLLLDDARYWSQHDTYRPLEAAARFHHRMVLIHPFANGNGRFARIATDLFLQKYFELPPITWASSLNFQIDPQRRSDYIAALRAADAGEFELLLQFVGMH